MIGGIRDGWLDRAGVFAAAALAGLPGVGRVMRALLLLVVFLALQFAPGAGIGEVQAATRPEAYASAMNQAQAYMTGRTCSSMGYSGTADFVYAPDEAGKRVLVRVKCVFNGNPYNAYSSGYWAWTTACPAGSTWDNASLTCFSSAACLAHNAEPGFINVGQVSKPFSKACVGGCDYRAQSPYSVVTAGGNSIVNGEFMFTGDACEAPAVAPVVDEAVIQDPPSQECVAAAAGQSVCVKKDGSHCYSGPIGRPMQFCWRPGETGVKGSADVMQARDGGTVPSALTSTPDGKPVTSQDSPMQSSTTTASGQVVVTTVQNFKVDDGTDATQADSGEPLDGSGTSPSDDPGEKGAASGGATCDSPPVCSGDPVGCATLAQEYAARCESAAFRDGTGADTSDGSSLLPANSSSLWDNGTSPSLDTSGFLASRTCPSPPTFTLAGVERTIDTSALCDLAGIIAALVLLMAFAQSAWILGES